MNHRADRIDALLDEADRQPFSGWDFGWLEGRLDSGGLPWDYTATVEQLAAESPDLLDLGTGGGEWLSGLRSLPRRTSQEIGASHRYPRVLHDVVVRWLVAAGCGQLAVAIGQDLSAWVVPVVIGTVLTVSDVIIFGRVPSTLSHAG